MVEGHTDSVLVVDDDSDIREILEEILSREGYDVWLAENGAEALDVMRKTPPDVVVLDLMMPVMSGWEVLAVTDEEEALRTIPILVASAMAAPLASRDQRGGVRTCLSKPLDIPALLDALRWITTPRKEGVTLSCSPPSAPPVRAEPEPLRALLVEDSENDAELVKRELTQGGFTVNATRVATQAEYVSALERGAWDVVLSDYALPGFNGRAALDILQGRGIDLPFVMVSGTVGEDIAVEVMKAGAHDYFSKGNLKRLPAAIRREVRNAERRKAEVSERRRASAELEQLLSDLRAAVKVRDDFLSIASHELRTPLTSLKLEVQLLQRLSARDGAEAIAPRLDAKLSAIDRQVTRLTTLIANLLEVSRLTGGHAPLTRENVDLERVVEKVLARTDEIIRQSRSEVLLKTKRVIGSWDRARVESIVTNLVLNAIKYGEGKPIAIELSTEGADARVVVSDRGMGIGVADQARIFEKFERAVPLEHFGGFGLGLWIARQAAVAHGGEIECKSLEGQGSTFTLRLPLTPPSGAS